MTKFIIEYRVEELSDRKIAALIRRYKGRIRGTISEETKKKISNTLKARYRSSLGLRRGHKHSEETKRRISESRIGEKHHFYGKPLSAQHRKNISDSLKGEKSSWYGRKHTNESRRKMSEAHIGKQRGLNHPGYGKPRSLETRRRISEAHIGKSITEEHKKKISESNTGEKNGFYGKRHTQEARERMSKAKSGTNHPCYGKQLSEERKKRISEKKSGENHHYYGIPSEAHPGYDHTRYNWYNKKLDKQEYLTPLELTKKYGLHRGAVTAVKNGKSGSHKGWIVIKPALSV